MTIWVACEYDSHAKCSGEFTYKGEHFTCECICYKQRNNMNSTDEEFELDIEKAEIQVAEYLACRLDRAERFCRISNTKEVCAGILKDFADLENKNLDQLLTRFAVELGKIGVLTDALSHYADLENWKCSECESGIDHDDSCLYDVWDGDDLPGFAIAQKTLRVQPEHVATEAEATQGNGGTN